MRSISIPSFHTSTSFFPRIEQEDISKKGDESSSSVNKEEQPPLSPRESQNGSVSHQQPAIAKHLREIVKQNSKDTCPTDMSWEAEHVITSDEKQRTLSLEHADPRLYPKTYDRYDLAQLSRWHKPAGPTCTAKAAKKYNLDHLALINKDNIRSQIQQFYTKRSSGGVPGYIDSFFRGEPGGRTEGYALHPEQFCATSFHPKLGGFLISPNPSNIPEIGQSYTNDASSLLEKTRGGKGFGLVCYWVPPGTHERYPTFQTLFPNTPIPDYAHEIEHQDNPPYGREKRMANVESNQEYHARTGIRFLSIPLDLTAEHVPLLEELKATVMTHLKDVYHCDPSKEKVEIYSHSPIYAMESCGLHVHVRVNEGRHPLESDLRNLDIDDAIFQLSTKGQVTHFPATSSGDFISYNVAAKMERAIRNGIKFTKVPNPWKAPSVKEEKTDFSTHPFVKRPNNLGGPSMSMRSALKYDTPEIGLLSQDAMNARISRYAGNQILPDFIYDFFTKDDNSKLQAFQQHPEQFPATSFTNVGGMLLMPNTKYIKGKSEFFPDASNVVQKTRHNGGFALVGYWVPPGVFEGRDAFIKLFSKDTGTAKSDVDARETVAEYNNRMETKFIVNPIDVKKCHIPMLKEFKEMSLKNLQEVYGVQPGKDKVDMYLHSPIYGNKTAGFHIHVRVNQSLPAGESDVNRLSFDDLLDILEDESVTDNDVQARILDKSAKTKSSQYIFSFSSAWGKEQFQGIPVKYVRNPWKRPIA